MPKSEKYQIRVDRQLNYFLFLHENLFKRLGNKFTVKSLLKEKLEFYTILQSRNF